MRLSVGGPCAPALILLDEQLPLLPFIFVATSSHLILGFYACSCSRHTSFVVRSPKTKSPCLAPVVVEGAPPLLALQRLPHLALTTHPLCSSSDLTLLLRNHISSSRINKHPLLRGSKAAPGFSDKWHQQQRTPPLSPSHSQKSADSF